MSPTHFWRTLLGVHPFLIPTRLLSTLLSALCSPYFGLSLCRSVFSDYWLGCRPALATSHCLRASVQYTRISISLPDRRSRVFIYSCLCGALSAPRQVSVSTFTFACRCSRHSRRFLLFSGIAPLRHLSCSSLICQFETLLIRRSLAPLGLWINFHASRSPLSGSRRRRLCIPRRLFSRSCLHCIASASWELREKLKFNRITPSVTRRQLFNLANRFAWESGVAAGRSTVAQCALRVDTSFPIGDVVFLLVACFSYMHKYS